MVRKIVKLERRLVDMIHVSLLHIFALIYHRQISVKDTSLIKM